MKLLTFGYALALITFMGFTPSPPNVVIYGLLFALAGVYIAAEDTLRRCRVRADGEGATPILKSYQFMMKLMNRLLIKQVLFVIITLICPTPGLHSIENNEN